MHVAVAPVCARCRLGIHPTDLRGRRATCPNCGPDVEVIHVAVGGPMNLVATFPAPRSPPSGMALERAAPPPPQAPAAPVGDGPFRTPGKLRVERREGGAVRIRLPNPRRGAAMLAIAWAGFLGFIAAVGAPITVPVVLGSPALILAGWWLRKKAWIELSPTTVWVHDDKQVTRRLDRDRITHLHCVCTNPSGYNPPNVPWEVWVTVAGEQTLLVIAGNRDHATAIAELLVHELGLPTWVPVPLLPARTW